MCQGCMCASELRICRETRGSLWDNMALEYGIDDYLVMKYVSVAMG